VNLLKTPVAAKQLGVSYHQLIGLLRFGKIDPPDRDSSGDYLWSQADLDRAREALAKLRRPRREGVASAF
jgi:hypothetical protein